jgi:hypothetical protein
MAKCVICKQWGMQKNMLKTIDENKPTIKACFMCYHLIKKYGKDKAMEIISFNKHMDNKNRRR